MDVFKLAIKYALDEISDNEMWEIFQAMTADEKQRFMFIVNETAPNYKNEINEDLFQD